jgi:transcriptional regulator with XRE-family HTH domain
MAQSTATGLPTIGDVVLAWRKFRGLRSTELVQKAGIKKGYLSALEHNKRATPQEAYLAKLADALGVPLQDIYGRRMPPANGGVVTPPSSQQGVAGQGRQQATSQRTIYDAPLSTTDQDILMHRMELLEEKLEAAEKNLREAHEQHREIRALLAKILCEE